MAYSQSVLDDIIVCIQGGQTDYAIAKLQNLKENIWNHQCLEDRLVESNCNESQRVAQHSNLEAIWRKRYPDGVCYDAPFYSDRSQWQCVFGASISAPVRY
jgi:hypothetical protein